jgi:hypothetical protein
MPHLPFASGSDFQQCAAATGSEQECTVIADLKSVSSGVQPEEYNKPLDKRDRYATSSSCLHRCVPLAAPFLDMTNVLWLEHHPEELSSALHVTDSRQCTSTFTEACQDVEIGWRSSRHVDRVGIMQDKCLPVGTAGRRHFAAHGWCAFYCIAA